MIIPGWGDGNSSPRRHNRSLTWKKLIIPGWGDGNFLKSNALILDLRRNWYSPDEGTETVRKDAHRPVYKEEIDNPRMRGRKPSERTLTVLCTRKKLIIPGWGDGNNEDDDEIYYELEEIDNPRMRGRKPVRFFSSSSTSWEEIDNPRMRGRKQVTERRGSEGVLEEIDNPRMRGRKQSSWMGSYLHLRRNW